MTPAQIASIWQCWPDTFAARASSGRWKPYPWIQYISKRITPSLASGGGRYVISAPPQHGKSQFISNWVPTWYLNRFPDRKVILASYAADYAAKWGAIVRANLTENPMAAINMRADTLSKRRFVTGAGGQMITAGVGGQITGEGANLLIIDDPVKNYEEAMSARVKERNLDWFRSVARTRLQPGGTIILLMTRWAEDDLAGSLIEEGFEEIRLPALCDDEETDPLKRKQGEALCPERYDAENLKATRTDVGEIIWEALYQQHPVGMSGNIIKGEWFRYYDTLPELDDTGLFADLSYKQGEETDFTVIEAWGRRGPDIYLISQIRARMGFPDQLQSFMRMCEAYPTAFHKEIEEKANGAALLEVARQTIPGLIAYNPKTDKLARLSAVAPIVQAGNVYLPNPDTSPWVLENVREYTKFPKWRNDDCADVFSMALRHFGQFNQTMARLEALARR